MLFRSTNRQIKGNITDRSCNMNGWILFPNTCDRFNICINTIPVSYTHLDVYKRQGNVRTAHRSLPFSVSGNFLYFCNMQPFHRSASVSYTHLELHMLSRLLLLQVCQGLCQGVLLPYNRYIRLLLLLYSKSHPDLRRVPRWRAVSMELLSMPGNKPVSYTHLDVYKRQSMRFFCSFLLIWQKNFITR